MRKSQKVVILLVFVFSIVVLQGCIGITFSIVGGLLQTAEQIRVAETNGQKGYRQTGPDLSTINALPADKPEPQAPQQNLAQPKISQHTENKTYVQTTHSSPYDKLRKSLDINRQVNPIVVLGASSSVMSPLSISEGTLISMTDIRTVAVTKTSIVMIGEVQKLRISEGKDGNIGCSEGGLTNKPIIIDLKKLDSINKETISGTGPRDCGLPAGHAALIGTGDKVFGIYFAAVETRDRFIEALGSYLPYVP